MTAQLVSVKDGSITIPDDLRERYGFEDGSLLAIEEGPDGIVIRSTDLPEVEVYTPERVAEFLLNNAVSERDYLNAVEEVKKLGIDPADIPHDRP
jgi:bifunctional DNA-binding transcriptional regulator/antitoxin component of YhaV-PrlF toxin-antitoxin module